MQKNYLICKIKNIETIYFYIKKYMDDFNG
jgi:hypothetical protein